MKRKIKKPVRPHKMVHSDQRDDERSYREIFDSASDAIFVHSAATGKIIDVNKAALRLFGWRSKKDVLARNVGGLSAHVPPFTNAEALRRMRLASSGKPQVFDWLARKRNGTTFWVEVALRFSEVSGEKRIRAVVRDINERRQAEEKLQYRTRLYAVLSQINQAIVRISDRNELMAAICRVCVTFGHYRMAWIGLIAEDQGVVTPAAFAGHEDGYVRKVLVVTAKKALSKGPTGHSIREGKLVTSDDIAADSRMKPWRNEALKRGYRSFASVPFRENGRVIGTLNLYAAEPYYFTKDEKQLLKEIGKDISFALDAIDAEEKRTRAEDALKVSLVKYKTLFDSFPLGITVADRTGKILESNLTAERILGLSRDEQLRREISGEEWHIVRPDGTPMPTEEYASVRALNENRVVENVEMGIVKPTGGITRINVTAAPLPLEEPGVVITYGDITERKKTEDALRESEARMRAIIDHAPYGAHSYELQANGELILVGANASAGRILHFDHSAVLGKRIEDAFPGLSGTAIPEAYRHVAATGESYSTDQVDYDEGIVQGAFEIHAFQTAPQRMTVFFRDITERKKAEKAFGESENRMKSIFRVAPVGIGTVSNRILKDVNAKLCEIAGYQQGELLGQSARILYPTQEEFDLVGTEKYRQIAEKGTGSVETRWQRKDGTIIDVLLSSTPIDPENLSHGVTFTALDITERKRSESVLKRYQLLSQNSRDVILFVRASDGRIVEANAAAVQTYGYDREELMTKSIRDLRALATTTDLAQQIEEAGRSGLLFETLHRRQDGTVFPVEVSSRGMMIGTDRILMSIIRDITKRKQVEEALRQNEQQLKLFVEHSPAAIAMFDKEMKYLIASRRWYQDYGLGDQRIIGRSHYDIFPEVPERWKDIHQRCLAGAIERCDEDPFPRADGRTDWVRWEIHPWHTPTDEIGGIIMFTEVITARKQAEESFRKSEANYRYLFETMPDGFYRSTHEGKFLEVNPAMVQILGYDSKEDLLAIDIKSQLYFAEQDRASAALEEKNEEMAVFRLKKKDGSEVWVEDHGRHVLDEKGNVLYHEGILRDITERKRIEEERQEMDQQIQQSEKLESLGLLAGGIAHDFNNLLSGIFGYVELARKSVDVGDTEKASERLSKALNVFGRARDLSRQLITFSKGGAPIRTPGDIGKTLSETVQFALSGSSARCEYSIASDLWPCGYDPNQISQVIDNIVINAKHAMPNGGVLEVSASNVVVYTGSVVALPGGNYIKISIRDHGIGIPQEYLKKIFDPFFTTKHSGSGLGLATCWSIVKRHDGTIIVDSEPGKGSTFHLYLPAMIGAVPVNATMPATAFVGHGRVLVMDDEEYVRDILEEMLSDLGYTVQTARDGAEAIQMFKQGTAEGNPFAFVLLDLTIPGGMGGEETLTKLVELEKNILVIASSGYSEDPAISRPREFGFAASIRKPYRKAELIEAIVNALAERRH
jgi:PAS domain S-box-containing protein